MKLYKITASFSMKLNGSVQDVTRCKFVGSQADGASYRKELMDEGAKRKDIETAEVNIPTDKQGLLDYLNGEQA